MKIIWSAIVMTGLIFTMTFTASAQSNGYRINRLDSTFNGARFLTLRDQLCTAFRGIMGERDSMIQWRGIGTAEADYAGVTKMWGFIDLLDAPSNAAAMGSFLETDAMVQAIDDALLQWCSKHAQ